ncbi:MAG: neuraminidase-like domain-containing protein, partial [Cyanobacteria bacterium J06607_13]
YPQKFAYRWGNWSDYLLSDIHTITAFKDLLDHSLSQQYSLSDLLNLELGYKKEPYRMLAEIFDWDIDEIKWLKRRNAFCDSGLDLEVNFNIELILKMQAIFKVADRVGSTPASLYALAHSDATGNLRAVEQTLYAWLKLKHSERDWEILSAELHNKLNLVKRDGLLPYVISRDNEADNARDLFAKMLVDVEMGNGATTSRIKEAISALQLYFHRYFVSLESLNPSGSADREQLKRWWQWMRNYRVWEANRKVFLYPENYIRPELRDTKTPAFQKLEEALLQGEVTPALVNTAFNDYLNEFSTVGNLKITGANVYDGDGDRTDDRLVLFGHTRTEPAQYYYRTAQFLDRGSAIWGNWLPVNISVNSTRVFPIHAFGRILVFWTEIEAYEESVPFISTKNSKAKGTEGSTSKVEDTDTVLKHRADIKYSFYDFNKQWVTPQTLQTSVELEYKIDAAYTDEHKRLIVFSGEYCLISTVQHPQGDIKKISEVYTQPNLPAERANENLPPEFHQGIDAAVKTGDRLIFFKGSLCAVKTGDTWQTHSIISYFRPQVPVIEYVLFNVLMWARYIIAAEFDNLYRWGIAAAFAVEGKVCLIDHQGMPLFFNPQPNGSFLEEEINHVETIVRGGVYRRHFSLINEYMRILTRNFMRLEPVDAVFEDENGIIYVVRKGQYECYQHDKNATARLEKLDGFPKPIKGNLSFNMDKFFNRLHLAEIPGKEAISLTYASPEANVALLSGIVRDDFTFVPGDLRTDYRKHAIWKLSHGFLTVPSVTQLATSVREAAALRQEIDDAIAAANRIEALERQVPILVERVMRVINSQEALNDNSDDSNRNAKFTVPPTVQREISALLDGTNGVIDLVDGGPERWTFGRSLKAAFEAYVSAPTNSWVRQFDQLQQARRDLRTTVSAEARQQRLVTLQSTLERISQNSLDRRQASSRQDIDEYQNIQGIFNQRLTDIGPILSTFELTATDSTINSLQGTKTNVNRLSSDIEALQRMVSAWSALIMPAPNTVTEMRSQLQTVNTQLTNFNSALATLKNKMVSTRREVHDLTIAVQDTAERLREIYFGNLDSFPSSFGIENQTNFTFGEPDWHIFEAKGGTFLCKPETGPHTENQPPYRIIRLTTTTIPTLSRHLFSGGPDRLLTITSQREREKPDFSPSQANSDTIQFNPSELLPPTSNNLDFSSANASYYWEIFFHVPSLIAQTLNRAQKFEAAKTWYEYIFDPTAIRTADSDGAGDPRWQFLPFIQAQQNSVTVTVEDSLHRTLEIENLQAEIEVYLNDPFDPHAIARIREVAYQKATMMAYIDNLLDWGDMLFRQYTVESINEARMLYILAYDLLGTRPAALGHHSLPEARSYANLYNPTAGETDLLIDTERTELAIATGTVHQTVARPYFFIPDNDRFLDYWNRVEDRLYKIRQSLNIDGIKQALPLFQPPIDPMSIVQAIAGGSSLSQITSGAAVPVPHYRFSFVFYKAKELVGRLNQFGGDLLAAIEKRDAEQLGLLQHRQEATILSMVTKVKEAQIIEAKETIEGLNAGLAMVEANEAYNQSTLDDGFLPYEIAQMSVMGAAVVSHAASAILRTIASFGGAAPDSLVGPFIAGIKIGGAQAYSSLSSASEVLQTVAEGLSIGGEIFGIVGQHERMMADVAHQVETAIHDKAQIQAQIAGAEQQLKIAEYELAIHEKEIEHHKSISTFMTSKFSNEQLYQWMSAQLSGLYYQSYKLA